MIDPSFSRQAATLLNAPYFYQGKGLERVLEKVELQKALAIATSLADLSPDMAALAKRAAASIKSKSPEAEAENRLFGKPAPPAAQFAEQPLTPADLRRFVDGLAQGTVADAQALRARLQPTAS